MTDGTCQIADDTCQITDDTCQMEDGKCQIAVMLSELPKKGEVTEEKAPNEANFVSTQSNEFQDVQAKEANHPARERTQFAAGGKAIREAHRSP